MVTPDPARRFTDQEVALVLKRAAEAEERRALSSAKGLTLAELQDIAREVGLSPEAIEEAVTGLATRRRSQAPELLGAPLGAKVARGVPGQLDQEALRQLIRVVEDRLDATGTVTDALGTVRWTRAPHGDRFEATTQVSISQAANETQIHVTQRYPGRLRAILHLLPGAWGAMIGGAVAASTVTVPGAGIALALGSAALGIGIGRAIWQTIARRATARVDSLSADLETAARRLAR
ncbi:MAG: hypothetical protein AB7R55_17930 [Gemmatimonadales bacterium]